jgi:hypothetical protein
MVGALYFFFIFIGEIFLVMLATALKFFYPHRRQRLNFFSDVGDSAEKYKPRPSKFGFFSLVSKSPAHTGLICLKTLEPNISSLGPFTVVTQ